MATIIKITEKSYVRVSKHVNGIYVQYVYNNGDNGGKIFVYQSLKAALKKANQIKVQQEKTDLNGTYHYNSSKASACSKSATILNQCKQNKIKSEKKSTINGDARIKRPYNLIKRFAAEAEFKNDIKAFGISEIFLQNGELYTTSEYSLPQILLTRLENFDLKPENKMKAKKKTTLNGKVVKMKVPKKKKTVTLFGNSITVGTPAHVILTQHKKIVAALAKKKSSGSSGAAGLDGYKKTAQKKLKFKSTAKKVKRASIKKPACSTAGRALQSKNTSKKIKSQAGKALKNC